jgi:23S rRNA pseudouridine2605 synthase
MVYSFNAEGGAEGQRPRPQSQLPERPQRYFRHRRKFRRAEEGERGRTPGLWKRRKDFQARRKRWQRRRAVLARRTRPKRLPPEPNPMSLARALTRLKYASHSVALRLIREGRVQVNDLTVLEPNVRVLVHKDRIVADGVELVFPPVQVYTVIFHKPPHVAASKELGMPTVYDYLPKKRGGYFPCGRLTKAADGLVIFSTDPLYRNPERSPLSLLEKEYHIKVHRHVKKRELEALTEELRRMSQYNEEARAELLRENSRTCWIRIVARQLPLHLLHRLLKEQGLEILHLHRYRLGHLTSEELPVGGWRRLHPEELQQLEQSIPAATERTSSPPAKAPAWQQLYQRIFQPKG